MRSTHLRTRLQPSMVGEEFPNRDQPAQCATPSLTKGCGTQVGVRVRVWLVSQLEMVMIPKLVSSVS